MYIRCLSYILDIRYVYQMSKLYIRCPVYILDIRYAVDGAKEPQWLIVHFGTPYTLAWEQIFIKVCSSTSTSVNVV